MQEDTKDLLVRFIYAICTLSAFGLVLIGIFYGIVAMRPMVAYVSLCLWFLVRLVHSFAAETMGMASVKPLFPRKKRNE